MTHPSPEPTSAALAALATQTQRMQARGVFSADYAGRIPSPCLAMCQRDAARQQCLSCLRTFDEIRTWNSADSAQRLLIWRQVLTRAGLNEHGQPLMADA